MTTRPDAGDTNPSALSRYAPILFWIGLLCLAGMRLVWMPLHTPPGDYPKHWEVARILLQGGTLYAGDGNFLYSYPLFAAYLFVPLGFLSIEEALVVWRIVGIGSVLGGTALAAIALRPRGKRVKAIPPAAGQASEPTLLRSMRNGLERHWFACCLLAVALNTPVYTALAQGNMDAMVYMVMVLFGVLLVRGWEKAAGLVLAFAVLVKVMPVILLGVLVATRRWKVVRPCVAVLGCYALLLLVTGAWKTELVLYLTVLPNMGFEFREFSYSLHHLLALWFFPAALEGARQFARFSTLVNIPFVLAYLAVCYAGWRRPWRKTEESDAGLLLLCFAILTLPLFTPLLEYNHLSWVSVALYMQLYLWRERRMNSAGFMACLFGWALIASVDRLQFYSPGLGLNFQAYWFLPPILIVLSALCAWMAFENRREGKQGS